MTDCLFCKIVTGKIYSTKVWEDEFCLAILDLFPNTEGMTVVMTKKHYPSYVFDMDEKIYNKFMTGVKKVAQFLDLKLPVLRTAMVMEGMGVNHAHIKLYPLHGLDKECEFLAEKEGVFYDRYPGFITTKRGPQTDRTVLDNIAKKFKK